MLVLQITLVGIIIVYTGKLHLRIILQPQLGVVIYNFNYAHEGKDGMRNIIIAFDYYIIATERRYNI